MPLIVPGNVATATAATTYDIANSIKFNDDDSAYLKKARGDMTTATDQKKFTVSVWVKRSEVGDAGMIWSAYHNATNNLEIEFNDDDTLRFQNTTSGVNSNYVTNREFRDVSAWYHIMYIVDTTDSTAGDRQQIWINGVRETSFSTSVSFNEDAIPEQGSTDIDMYVGREGGGSNYFDGYIAENVFIDGTAYAATSFGEFDEDSPTIWKPKDVSGLTFGNNGYHLDFEASGNLGNDINGGTDFAETNVAATDQTTDTPTNSFCTFMSHTTGSYTTLSEGGLITTGNTASDNGNSLASFGMTNGKWYWEFEWDNIVSGYGVVGVIDTSDDEFGHQGLNGGAGYAVPNGYNISTGGNMSNGSSEESGWTADYSNGNILGMALDMDNGAWYLHLNGTYYDSGDPTSGGSKTGAVVGWTPNGKTLVPWDATFNGSITKYNFGNPSFTISSGNADANGYGNFEYAVPSGYFALCTKNLGESGG